MHILFRISFLINRRKEILSLWYFLMSFSGYLFYRNDTKAVSFVNDCRLYYIGDLCWYNFMFFWKWEQSILNLLEHIWLICHTIVIRVKNSTLIFLIVIENIMKINTKYNIRKKSTGYGLHCFKRKHVHLICS